MKTGNELKKAVYGYWAKRFECDRRNFIHPGTLVIKEEELAETRKIHIYHIDGMSVVRVDPAVAKLAGLPDGYAREFGSLTVDIFQRMVGEAFRVEEKSTFLGCYLDPKDFEPFTLGEDFAARRLWADNDSSHLLSLYEASTEEELDKADIYVDEPDPVIYGIFVESQLVAYASHRYWDDVIADIGVLVHPRFRGQGLGKAVVSGLCEWCIENEVVPMYRVFSDHRHSVRISQSLGFKELVVIETLKVTERDIG